MRHVWLLFPLLFGCATAEQRQAEAESDAAVYCNFVGRESETACTANFAKLPREYRVQIMAGAVQKYTDSIACQHDGASVGTPVYAQCMATRELIHAQEAANMRPQVIYQSAPPAYGAPPPAFSPPINCTTTYGGRTATQPGVAFTNCN